MKELIITLVVSVFSSTALFSFIQFLINRRDKRKNNLDRLEKKLSLLESDLRESHRSSSRTELMLLMKDYPENKTEILLLAEHYFKVLGGDFYMTALFTKYLEDNGLSVNFEYKH